MNGRETVRLETGFILHRRPYKNTSELIDCFTEHYGVITLIAQGSRRPRSDRRVVLQPFSLLKLQRIRLDPVASASDKDEAFAAAKELGLEVCRDCPGCKCGVGIDLKRKVIEPLLEVDSEAATKS